MLVCVVDLKDRLSLCAVNVPVRYFGPFCLAPIFFRVFLALCKNLITDKLAFLEMGDKTITLGLGIDVGIDEEWLASFGA